MGRSFVIRIGVGVWVGVEVFHFFMEEVDVFVGEEDVFGEGLMWIFVEDLGVSFVDGDLGSDGGFFEVIRVVVDGVGE